MRSFGADHQRSQFRSSHTAPDDNVLGSCALFGGRILYATQTSVVCGVVCDYGLVFMVITDASVIVGFRARDRCARRETAHGANTRKGPAEDPRG